MPNDKNKVKSEGQAKITLEQRGAFLIRSKYSKHNHRSARGVELRRRSLIHENCNLYHEPN